MAFPDRTLGVVLMNANCSVPGTVQYFNDKVIRRSGLSAIKLIAVN